MDNIRAAYNVWSETYDTVENKTRDLEFKALRELITNGALDILEIGCGTGKNTVFLQDKAKTLIGADFSEEMLSIAKSKISADNVKFCQLDLRSIWEFPENNFDLVTASLVLEHIQNLDFVFNQANNVLRSGGQFYIGELHPFKQYIGSKARFETESGIFVLECFTHNVSDFLVAGKNNNFELVDLKEWFDDDNRSDIPRLLTIIFRKK